MKKTLILNSHTLRDYKLCPQRFYYTHEKRLEPREKKDVFEKGTVISQMLQAYYDLKVKMEITPRHLMDIIESVLKPFPNVSQEDKDLIEVRFLQYYKYYRNEAWVPITTEIGFSKVLFEDENYLFVYEGRPDYYGWLNSEKKEKLIADHKSQGRKYDYYFYNDQALGYNWATDTRIFVYNYFGLQTSGVPDEWFRRTSKIFRPDEIKEWETRSINWCKKIVHDQVFEKSWLCQNGWGICEYAKLCEAQHDFAKADIASRFYQISTYRSW